MRILPEKETLKIEFKSDVDKLSDSEIFEAVVAFANTEGGTLYLGIEDTGEITGVHKSHENPVTLSAFIANNTIPPISVRVEVLNDVLPILAISVPKLSSGIAATANGKVVRRRIKADGMPENVPMYPTEMATRLSDIRLLDYSGMLVTGATLSDFDLLEVERLKRIVLAYDGGDKALLELTDEEMFKALSFVKEQNGSLIPTIAGILMIGKSDSIKRYIPTAASVFQVLEGTKVRVNEDFVMPILASVEKINTYLEAWNPEHEIEIGLFRVAAPDFNKRALREAIINAYSHRDYSKMGRVRISINDEGITIANPGGFVEGVSIENLLTAEPHGRNTLLADALKRVGLAEKTGRGIDRIYEGSLLYGRLLPDYSASTSVTVSLFIPRSAPDLEITRLVSDEQKRLGRPLPVNTLLVLNILKDMPRSHAQQIARAVSLSEIMVKTVLERLIISGLVEAYGSGKNRNYSLSHNAYLNQNKKIGYIRQKDIDEKRYNELIIDMAGVNKFISRADVINLLHVDTNKAYRLLKKLVTEGRLSLIGKGRYAKYKIKK